MDESLRDIVYNTEREDIEYEVWHWSPTLSYYNIHPTKLRAYLEAIRPRYWKCETIVTPRVKVKLKIEVDFSHVT